MGDDERRGGPGADAAPEPSGDERLPRALAAVRAGDSSAYRTVVEICEARLMSFAMSLLKERGAAAELTQDAFVQAYRRLERYDHRRPFYPWLATLALRLAQNRWRTERRRLELARSYGAEGPSPQSDRDPLSGMLVSERHERLWRAVHGLPARERAATTLFYQQELSVRDVARALGVSTGTVKTLLFRARRHLREALAADTGDDSR